MAEITTGNIHIDALVETREEAMRNLEVYELTEVLTGECRPDQEVLDAWKDRIDRVVDTVTPRIAMAENDAADLYIELDTIAVRIDTLVATPPTGNDCYIASLSPELLELIFMALPRYNHALKMVCVRFSEVVRSPKLRQQWFHDRLYTRTTFHEVSALLKYTPQCTVVAGGDGKIWTQKVVVAIGTNIQTGEGTRPHGIPLGFKLVGVSPGGVVFYQNETNTSVGSATPGTGVGVGPVTPDANMIKVKGEVVGVVSDTKIVVHETDAYRLVVVDVTGATDPSVLFAASDRLYTSNTGTGIHVGWFDKKSVRAGVFIKYNDTATVVPTNYSRARYHKWVVPITGTDCVAYNEANCYTTSYSFTTLTSNRDALSMSFCACTPTPLVVVVVGTNVVVATGSKYKTLLCQ